MSDSKHIGPTGLQGLPVVLKGDQEGVWMGILWQKYSGLYVTSSQQYSGKVYPSCHRWVTGWKETGLTDSDWSHTHLREDSSKCVALLLAVCCDLKSLVILS